MVTFIQYTHTEPELLARNARRLYPHRVIVHVDAKVDIRPFEAAAASTTNITLVRKRVLVNWGGYSQVEAIRILVHEALKVTEDHDFIVLLSGQDYSLRTGPAIQQLLAKQDVERMNLFEVDESIVHYYRHFQFRHFRDLPLLAQQTGSPSARRLRNGLIRLLELLCKPFIRPKCPPGLVLAFGPTHFCLRASTLRMLEGQVTREIESYFRGVFCPEEHFYQSLMASMDGDVKKKFEVSFDGRGNFRYANIHVVDESLTRIFTIADWPEVAGSKMLVLRKVRAVDSAELLDRIDRDLTD